MLIFNFTGYRQTCSCWFWCIDSRACETGGLEFYYFLAKHEVCLIVSVLHPFDIFINKQIAGWGADGVIIGSAVVRQLCEAATPEEGLKRLEEYSRSIKAAMP